MVNDVDPKYQLRVQIRIPFIHDNLNDNELPWAAPLYGFTNIYGNFEVPRKDNLIYVFMHDGNVLDPVYIPKLYHYKPQPKDNIEYDNRFYKSKSYNIFPNEYYNPNWSTKT